MKQYNRIMPGEGGRYIRDCLNNSYVGVNFLSDTDLTDLPHDDEGAWKRALVATYLRIHPDKSVGTARNSVGFLWTICHGLRRGDVVLAANGNGGYCVGEIAGDYYYALGQVLPHRRPVKWLDVVIERRAMSQQLKNSTGSIGTCCNITKYADELERLVAGAAPAPAVDVVPVGETYKESSLHRLLANYLLSRGVLAKTLFHQNSNHREPARKWVHPDMVGVEYNEFQEPATRSLLRAAETKEYVTLYSFELKRAITGDHQLKEYFFQALSNSSWANYGYLVAFEIADDVMEELARLNRAFGIGVIRLSPYVGETEQLFPARKNELDYYTIDKLCRLNADFKAFVTKAVKVLNAQAEVIEDVKGGLQKFCDKGFSSEEEILAYCKEHHIPC